MQGKNKIDVTIGGQGYALVGAEPDEYIKKVAEYIDGKMSEISKMNNKLSIPAAATLTAVNVADEFFKASEKFKELKGEGEAVREEIKILRDENKKLIAENTMFSNNNANLHLELAKKHENEKSIQREIQQLKDRINSLVDEKEKLIHENAFLSSSNTKLNIELAKCTEEIIELRNTLEKATIPVSKR